MEADFGGRNIIYDVVVALKSSSPIAGDRQRGHDQGSEPQADVPRGCLRADKVHLTHALGFDMRQGELSQLAIRLNRYPKRFHQLQRHK